MSSASSCQCQSGSACSCSTGSAVTERPRYYPRQLITASEMTLEQEYFREKLRRHNRFMHGWGVVCGAAVCAVIPKPGAAPTPWLVSVSPGVILGPYGDEIVIDQLCTVNVKMQGGTTSTTATMGDPWCSEVPKPPSQQPPTCYIAVKYLEIPTRPVRITPSGCGCQDTPCENSRILDGYEISCLSSCPASHQNPPATSTFFQSCQATCPPCPSDPWVVLAKVDFSTDGTPSQIDNCSCRRCVLTAAPYWLSLPVDAADDYECRERGWRHGGSRRRASP